VEDWLAARRQLLGAAERRLFANALLERLALDERGMRRREKRRN
jgi:hypothetical protein